MYPMPGTPEEDESNTFAMARENQDYRYKVPVWTIWTVGVIYAAFLIGLILSDDTVRLYSLHKTVRILQRVSAYIGMWGLRAEKGYYDRVNVLH